MSRDEWDLKLLVVSACSALFVVDVEMHFDWHGLVTLHRIISDFTGIVEVVRVCHILVNGLLMNFLRIIVVQEMNVDFRCADIVGIRSNVVLSYNDLALITFYFVWLFMTIFS